MPYDVKEAPSWPVNELGEIVMQTGRGSSNTVGFIPSNQVPIDPDTRKVVMSGATRSSITMQQKPLLFLGDSLTAGATNRIAGVGDHRPWWTTTSLVTTAFGTNWIVKIVLDGRASGAPTGMLETDGAGKLRWTFTGDTAGPWTDVSTGGFFLLNSGTSIYQLSVMLRNSSASNVTMPVGAGSGAVSVSGFPCLISYDLLGFPSWVIGAMGDTFSDYLMYGISGDNTENLLSRTPQALASSDVSAIVVLIGTNDNPSNAAQVTAEVTRFKAIIDLCLTKTDRVYVGDIFPRADNSVAGRKFLALVSSQVRDYCKTKFGVRFWSAYDAMVDPTAAPTVALAGVLHTDNLHLTPYGGYRAAADLVKQLKYDFFVESNRKSQIDTYDATLVTGAWNANPTLRGTAGTVTASRGITGTVPDSWTLDRGNGAGGTQTCTTGFDAVVDGTSWFSLSVANAGASDDHRLTQTVAIPAEINNGDLFRCVVEFKIFNANLINSFQINALSNLNNMGVYTVWINRNLSTFATEQPELVMPSEPITKVAGMTSLTLALRLGGAAGSSGKVGVRSIRVEKV
jgi:lysophospholipase L1-like esterase